MVNMGDIKISVVIITGEGVSSTYFGNCQTLGEDIANKIREAYPMFRPDVNYAVARTAQGIIEHSKEIFE